MLLKFYWLPHKDGFIPSCAVSALNDYGISPIQQFLMDLGGGGESPDEYTAWIADAITKIDKIRVDGAPADSLFREVMSAELGPEMAELNSHREDKAYQQTIEIATFRAILVAWHKFLLAGPNFQSEMEAEGLDYK